MKLDELKALYMEMKNSTDIASSTLELYIESLNDDFDIKVLFGIMGQLETVKSRLEELNNTMCGGVA